MEQTTRLVLAIAAVLIPLTAAPQTPAFEPSGVSPEAASGWHPVVSSRAPSYMAATANPLATRVARSVLARGGSATDAVVAAQMMLALVEPQSSGIGGGAFLVTFDAATGRVDAWDGRETAPAAVDERMFLDPQGRPIAFAQAVVGGHSVGVPGAVRMLEYAHRRLGQLPWRELLEPAITTARTGFDVSPRLAAQIAADPYLKDDPVARDYFFGTDGKALAAGHPLRNPALAETLEALADRGSDALHRGPLAAAIVAKVRDHPLRPGRLSEADLAGYTALRREPLCFDWLRWTVCGMPPPSSGTLAIGQMLGMLEATDSAGLVTATVDDDARLDADAVHRFSEAGRLAYADRARYVADPDFVPLPPGLLAPDYLAARARQIGERSMGVADAGRPAPVDYPERGTSHVSVVDRNGNAAALTTTIESGFGSRQMVAGFLLNNQLTDFSFVAREPADPSGGTRAVANRAQPLKRPRSSMAPLLVFERTAEVGLTSGPPPARSRSPGRRGPLVMVTGSPGGSAIINYVAKTLIATLQDGLDPQQAIDLPNVGSRNGPTELERGRVSAELVRALRARGHEIREIDLTSGIQTIVRRCPVAADGIPDRSRCNWIGAADPRREGLALGG